MCIVRMHVRILYYCTLLTSYRMRLNFRGTKLSRIANLHNIRGFYFRG